MNSCRRRKTKFLSITLATTLLAIVPRLARGEFTTVINAPPDLLLSLSSNTQINLHPGEPISNLRLGDHWSPLDNIEVNLLGGDIVSSLESSNFRYKNTNVVFNIRSGTVGDSVWVDNANVANVFGGSINYALVLSDQAVANISGGSIGQLVTGSNSNLNLYGGDFRLNGAPLAGLSAPGASANVALPEGSLLTGVFADGTPFALSEQDSYRDYVSDAAITLHAAPVPQVSPETIHASSGSLPPGLRGGQRLVVDAGAALPRNFNATWGSVVDVVGGQLGDHFQAAGAVVNLSSGEIGGQSALFRGAAINMSGGRIGSNLNVGSGSAFHMTGGVVDQLLEAHPDSDVTIAGGVVQPLFIAQPDSRVALIGSGFRVNGLPVSGLNAVGIERQLDLPNGAVLSGTFADGRQFAFSDQIFDRFSPGTLTLRAAAAPALGPAVINSPHDPAPAGLQSGQRIVVTPGGAIGDNFNADWGSVVAVDGGQVAGNFEAVGAQVNVTAGYVGWRLDAFYGSTINISGGLLEGLVRAHHGSVINVSGGQIGYYLKAGNGGVVNVSGGVVGYGADCYDGGVFNVTGGEIGEAFSISGGTLNLRGGSIGDNASVSNDASANLSGGTIGDGLQVFNGARLLLTGADFRLNGEPIEGMSPYGLSSPIDVPAGALLSGTLRDGTPFAFSNSDGDLFEAGSIRLALALNVAEQAPTIDLPTGPAPTGVGAGQSLVATAGRTIGNRFSAGWGSSVTVAGGTVGQNFEAVGSQVLMTSGSIGDDFDAFHGSVVTIAGGEVGPRFHAHNGSVVNITGGRIDHDFTVRDGSVVNVSGGQIIGTASVEGGGVMNVTGGHFGDWFHVAPSAELSLFGSDFWLDGVPVAGLQPGQTISLGADDVPASNLSVRLTALLTDGSMFETFLFAELFEGAPGSMNPHPTTRVTLTSVTSADLNADGLVDGVDLDHWKNSFGAGADGADFLAWQRQFGAHAVAMNHPIPEPAAWTMAMLPLVALLASARLPLPLACGRLGLQFDFLELHRRRRTRM